MQMADATRQPANNDASRLANDDASGVGNTDPGPAKRQGRKKTGGSRANMNADAEEANDAAAGADVPPAKKKGRKKAAKGKANDAGEGDEGDDAGPKKRGNPGDFHGRRETFLISREAEYNRMSATRKTREFWPKLFFDYFKRFDWRTPLKEEPKEEDMGDTRDDAGLSKQEQGEKAERLEYLEKVSIGAHLKTTQIC